MASPLSSALVECRGLEFQRAIDAHDDLLCLADHCAECQGIVTIVEELEFRSEITGSGLRTYPWRGGQVSHVPLAIEHDRNRQRRRVDSFKHAFVLGAAEPGRHSRSVPAKSIDASEHSERPSLRSSSKIAVEMLSAVAPRSELAAAGAATSPE